MPRSVRLLFSVGLPVLLGLIFLLMQLIDFDSIGWHEGFNHPLSGWDHLVTMVAVGIWAAQLRGKAIWMLPMAFVGVMSIGSFAGAANLSIPSVEGIILLSVAVFSVLIARKVRFNTNINLLIVAFFAFFHGFAHGHEISTSTSLISYILGFTLATLLLHGSGIMVAKLVVLIMAFMMSALFSSNALAEAYAVSIAHADGDAVTTSFLQNQNPIIDYNQRQTTTSDIDKRLLEKNGRWRQQCCFRVNAVYTYQTAAPGGGVSSVLQTSSAKYVKALKTSTNFPSVANCSSVAQESFNDNRSVLLTFDNHSPTVLSFKYYFPEINHTPGQHLSSGGVGLTSPPVERRFLASLQVAPHLRNTSISFIDADSLQSINAKVCSGNGHIKSLQDRFVSGRHLHRQMVASSMSNTWSFVSTKFNPLNSQQNIWAQGSTISQRHSKKQGFRSSA